VDRRTIEDYQAMMADRLRMQAYQRAIARVCPKKIVCEIGVGLAPLSLMALEAGATKVYGIELNPETLEVATQIMADNGYGPEHFIPIEGLSTQIELPEQADVLLSETLDSMGIGENTAVYMADARARLMKPDACFLPAGLDCHIALASPAVYQQKMAFWTANMPSEYGMRYERAAQHYRTCKHTIPVSNDELSSDWIPWQHIDLLNDKSYQNLVPLVLQVTRPGPILGYATAFDARLCEGVHIRTFPDDPDTHWHQGFNAFPQPYKPKRGTLSTWS